MPFRRKLAGLFFLLLALSGSAGALPAQTSPARTICGCADRLIREERAEKVRRQGAPEHPRMARFSRTWVRTAPASPCHPRAPPLALS